MVDFTWPDSYRALRDEGRFDYWGAPYDALTEADRDARTASHRHLVLWWRSIEWVQQPDEERPDWMRPGLVPFARNGWGDLFCFYPRWQEGPEPPVVLWTHDAEDSVLWARSFSELLWRHLLLEQVAWSAEHDGDEQERCRLFRAHAAIVSPHLTASERASWLALGGEPSQRDCESVVDDVVRAIGARRLRGSLPPERYQEDLPHLHRRVLVDCYSRDVAFLRELVEVEGHESLRPRLELARSHLARVGAKE